MFTSQQFAAVQNPPNPELRWEKLGIFNIGFDFALKNDRVTGSIDYYQTIRYGIDSSIEQIQRDWEDIHDHLKPLVEFFLKVAAAVGRNSE